MKKTMMTALTLSAALTAGADGKLNDWENLAVNSINRLPARTYTMPLADEAAALTDALQPETPYAKSLNGDWKILWVGDPARRPMDFFKPDYDDSDWNVIDVPSCVEMRGYGTPGYTNVRYPHANAWPKILDRDTGRPDYNPVSSYRTTFTVPEAWAGRDVILRFDGVYSAYYVWVDGALVGYAEDSKLPSEFNITKFLRESQISDFKSQRSDSSAPSTKHQAPSTAAKPPSTKHQAPGTHTLAVQVFRWCDGSYLEDQDMFRFSGIFRDVTLWAKPKDGIWDFTVRTTLTDNYTAATLSVDGIDGAWSATLYDAEKKAVGTLASDAATLAVPGVRLWSAEKPYLYTLVVKKGADIRMKKVGFKEQKIVGNTVLVNGKPVKFKGVNRHETNPDNGRTVSVADMIQDIELMKKFNINTVRTCHYPDHHLWYDLCDRYGIYLVAEANVEGHEPGYSDKGLGRFPEFDHSIVERNERNTIFYRNNPSVVFWSMGNETGHGDCFRHAIAAVKKLDPSRIVHWERGNADADIDSSMYPSVEWLECRGKLGNAKAGGKLEGEGGGEGFAISGHTAGKPYIMCEYAHAMGNAIGNFQEYWDLIYTYPALVGGCIWDWVDQAVWKYTDRVDPKTGQRERFLAYGGDFDEVPNDGPFCCNGVVDPFRRVNPKLVEVGHVYRDLAVRLTAGGVYELENRFHFTDADEFTGRWELLEEGVAVASGALAVPAVTPGAKGALLTAAAIADAAARANVTLDPAKEHFVNFAFATKADTLWAKKGHLVARDQVAWPSATAVSVVEPVAGKIVVEETDARVIVECAHTTAIFDRRTGTLSELYLRGEKVVANPASGIVGGPQLTCLRAYTDNDRWMALGDAWGENRKRGYQASGLTQLSYHPGKIVVDGNTMRTVVDVAGAKGCGFTHESVWTFLADGSITLKNKVTPYGVMPAALPRLGLTWRLPPRFEQMTYYGRGPWENYIDRCTGSFIGRYTSTVTDQFVEYVRPQDNGAKADVRWVEFTDSFGRGVRFSSAEPFFLQALHYGWEDLEFSRHVNGQRRYRTPLVPRDEIVLNLDVRQTGLGGASCGPITMNKYRFDPNQPVEWSLTIEAVTKK